jgi:hypothetical protein
MVIRLGYFSGLHLPRQGERRSNSKKNSKEWIMVLFASNGNGSVKLPPFVIEKGEILIALNMSEHFSQNM